MMAINALGKPPATTMKGNDTARPLTTPKIKQGSTGTCAGVVCLVDGAFGHKRWIVGFTPVIKRGSTGAAAGVTCQCLRVGFFAKMVFTAFFALLA